jgi:hypothetical protein
MRGSSGYPIGTVGISIGGSGSSGYSVIPVSVGALVVVIVSTFSFPSSRISNPTSNSISQPTNLPLSQHYSLRHDWSETIGRSL